MLFLNAIYLLIRTGTNWNLRYRRTGLSTDGDNQARQTCEATVLPNRATPTRFAFVERSRRLRSMPCHPASLLSQNFFHHRASLCVVHNDTRSVIAEPGTE
ncbi:hypothetical protein PUN28_013977 [Cardiocondyla obscurior]|uniref:Transposase n=1 Tax=Cardiocondyla obscurior TaxID=286306 RepID=A0AAW2F3Y1_9HYME